MPVDDLDAASGELAEQAEFRDSTSADLKKGREIAALEAEAALAHDRGVAETVLSKETLSSRIGEGLKEKRRQEELSKMAKIKEELKKAA